MMSKRVLCIIDQIAYGSGVSSVVMNYYSRLDDKRIHMDFVVHAPVAEDILSDIKKRGSVVYELAKLKPQNVFSYRKKLGKIYTEGNYDIIHCHMPHRSVLYFPEALKSGINIRISHSHNSMGADSRIKSMCNAILRKLGNRYATHFIACSKMAADFAFGKANNAMMLYNAVDYDRFRPAAQVRKAVRKELSVGDGEFLICHVGRFAPQKNQLFLIQAFSDIVKKSNEEKNENKVHKDVKLLLIGEGELKQQCRKEAERLGIEDRVIFVGVTYCVEGYLQASDLFVLPSLYEGLPVSVVEAQAAGLECLCADTVTAECDMGGCTYIPLERKKWTEKMLECVYSPKQKYNFDESVFRSVYYDKRFDIAYEAEILSSYYEQGGEYNEKNSCADVVL